MLRLLLLAFIFSHVATNEINEAVDEIVIILNHALYNAGLNRIPIARTFYHWKYHLIPGTMNCYKGWAHYLGSLHRVADVEEVKEKNSRVLRIPLSIASLEFGYERCDITVIKLINWKGRVRASVDTNWLEAIVTIRRDENVCTTTLDRINFTNIGEITVTTGGKIIHWMDYKVAQHVAGQLKKDIVGRIIDKLQVVGSLIFENSDLCNIED